MAKGKHPFVSVIVAVRNEEKHIRECLDSLLAQDYPRGRYEVLVVDGQSTDGTREIVEGFASICCSIIFIEHVIWVRARHEELHRMV
jgi:glycosyltransferase involved in cell wall biosynthesis